MEQMSNHKQRDGHKVNNKLEEKCIIGWPYMHFVAPLPYFPKASSQKNEFENVEPLHMMTSSKGNIFRVTGLLRGEFTGDRWIPRTKTSDAELWCFLWSAPERTIE